MNIETIINIFLVLITGIVGWFVKQSISFLVSQISRMSEKLHNLEINMPLNYVRREDWLRELSINDDRVDKLQKMINEKC